VAQQLDDEMLGDRGAVQVGALQLRLERAPQGQGDLEGAADLVLELEAGRQLVVGLALVFGLTQRGLFQMIRQQEPALQADAGQAEDDPMLVDSLQSIVPVGVGPRSASARSAAARHTR
jgi:hypothetical protein